MFRAIVLVLCACALLSGCELVADFDRSKIVQDAGGDGDGDGAVPDAAVDEDAGSDDDAG